MRFAIAFLAEPLPQHCAKIHIFWRSSFWSACKNNLWGPSTILRAEMIDGVPGCLPSSESRTKTETETETESVTELVTESRGQSRRQVNPKSRNTLRAQYFSYSLSPRDMEVGATGPSTGWCRALFELKCRFGWR